MEWINVIWALVYGLVEGITEWLPISSTGHLILLEQFLPLTLSEDFITMFRVVIQLGAILAVVVRYWSKIWPFPYGYDSLKGKRGFSLDHDILTLWLKIIVASIPAGIVGVLFDDKIDELFYNPTTVAIMLILIGIAFILVERTNKHKNALVSDVVDISLPTAGIIGMAQVLAAVLPGTSRSGATILAGIMIGLTRTVAAEFTFYMAIPVMLGASALKLVKMPAMTGLELVVLLVGMATAYLVSYVVIGGLMQFIKKHDFTAFGYYRIALGCLVLIVFQLVL